MEGIPIILGTLQQVCKRLKLKMGQPDINCHACKQSKGFCEQLSTGRDKLEYRAGGWGLVWRNTGTAWTLVEAL